MAQVETRKRGKADVAETTTPMPASNSAPMSRADLLQAYEMMLTIRRFEERAGQMYGMGLIGGFCHLYIGQEAIVVGLHECRCKPGDQVRSPAYRDHGHMLATGHRSARR